MKNIGFAVNAGKFHDELWDKLSRMSFDVSRATTTRDLNSLVASGNCNLFIISSALMPGDSDYFEEINQ